MFYDNINYILYYHNIRGQFNGIYIQAFGAQVPAHERFFKVILVTGARQVGKTTMLRHLAEGQNRTYVTLDNMMARRLAQSDPALFFQTYPPPVLIDEVQYAPELFE